MVSADFAVTVTLGTIQIVVALFALWQNYVLRPYRNGGVSFP